MLESGRDRAGLDPDDLWVRYFALGGSGDPTLLARWLTGTARIPAADWNLLIHAINERLGDLGHADRLPYSDD